MSGRGIEDTMPLPQLHKVYSSNNTSRIRTATTLAVLSCSDNAQAFAIAAQPLEGLLRGAG